MINHFKKYSLFYAIFLIGAMYLIPNFAYAFTDPVQVQISAKGHPIRNVWEALLNFANVAALIFFLAIAFANLLRIQINVYGIKKILPSLIVGIILANFSLLISQLLLDLSGAAAGLFREGSGFTNQWINSTDIFPNTNTGDFIHIIFGAALKIIAAVMVMILAVMFLLRNYVLMFLVVFAPIAFLSMALPATKGLWTRWWKSFTQWTFMLPVAMFWLWVGANFFQFTAQFNASEVNFGTGISFAGYVFGVICVYMAMTTPFKMAGELSSLAGKVQKAALTATGVYAGTKLAQRGIQGVKQAAGETIQGVALNRTPYGNIVRALKQTAEGRKSNIDKGMAGPVARSEWGQRLLNVATFGGRVGPEAARRVIEANKHEKQDLELLAEERNVDDPKLQARIRELRTKATVHKGAVEQKKSELEREYYRGKKSKEMDKLLERFNEEELAEYEKIYQSGDKKALAEFIERKLREKAIARITSDRRDEIRKEKEQTLILGNQPELERIKERLLQPLIKQRIKEMKDEDADAIKGKDDQKIQNYVSDLVRGEKAMDSELQEQVKAEFLKSRESEISQASESQIKTEAEVAKIVSKADSKIKKSKDEGQWEEITLQYRDQFESASYWHQTEGKRVNDALSGEIEAALGPMMAEKTKGDSVLDFSTQDLRKIDAALKLKSVRDAGGDPIREEALLKVFSSNPDEADKLAQEFLDDYAKKKDYWKLRQNRLKYSFRQPQLSKSARGFAESRDAEESLAALSEEKISDDELASYLSGMPEGLSAKHQQVHDRFSMEQDFHLRQNVLNSGFIPAINAIGKMMSGDQAFKVKVVEDKTGRILDEMTLADVVGRTFMSKFIYLDKSGSPETSLKTLTGDLRKDLLVAAKAGSTEVYQWLQKLAEKVNASATTPERTQYRSYLRDSGYLTLKGIVEGERWDVDDQKQKLIRQAATYKGPNVGKNGLQPSLTNSSEDDTAALTEEMIGSEEGEEGEEE